MPRSRACTAGEGHNRSFLATEIAPGSFSIGVPVIETSWFSPAGRDPERAAAAYLVGD